MIANRLNINDLRYLTRNNLIIPNNLDIRKNRTVSVEELIEHIFTTIKPAFYWPTIDAERIANHETGTCQQKLEHLQQLKLAV